MRRRPGRRVPAAGVPDRARQGRPACSSPAAANADLEPACRRSPLARPCCSSTVGPPDALRPADLREARRLRRVQRRRAPGDHRRVPGARRATPASSAARSCRPSRPRPRCACDDGERCSPTARSRTPRRSSAASTCSRPTTSTRALDVRRAHPGRPHGRLRRGAPAGGAGALIEQVFRDEWGRVVASLIGFLGDFDLAEEAAQEAFAIAAGRWPRDGAPHNPGAWLMTTARNRAIDRLRRERTLAGQDAPARGARGDGATRWTTRPSPTSAWSSSSPAAIPRSRSRRRWR